MVVDELPLAGTVVLVRDGGEVLLIRRPVRGSFASAWVFPGGVAEAVDLAAGDDDQDIARAAAVRECAEEVGLHATDLVPLARWMPPPEAPKRVRTWFFLAADPGGEVSPAPDEVVDWQWIRAEEALARHAAGLLELFPPTWVTLHGLRTALTLSDAVAAASEVTFFVTRVLPGGVFAWAGDAEHPEGVDGVHRLETAARPWRYRRVAVSSPAAG